MSKTTKRPRFDPLPLFPLMDEAQCKRALRTAVERRTWWIVPRVSEQAGAFLTALEARHYSGAKSDGFQVVMTPDPRCGVFAVGLAYKRFCPPSQMEAAMRASGADVGAALADRLAQLDVLVIPERAGEAALLEATVKVLMLNAWLYPETAAETRRRLHAIAAYSDARARFEGADQQAVREE